MPSSFFVDWCPRPTFAFGSHVSGVFDVDLQELAENFSRISLPPALVRNYILAVRYCYRKDGLFIFEIEWRARPEVSREFNIASITSHLLKVLLGHRHRFNHHTSCFVRIGSQQPLSRYPVKIAESTEADPEALSNFRTQLCDDDSVANLISIKSSHSGGDPQVFDADVPAILLIREKFSSIFDRSLGWCQATKDAQWFGFPVYRSFFTYFFIYFIFILFWLAFDVEYSRLTSIENPNIRDFSKFEILTSSSLSCVSFGLLVIIVKKIVIGVKLKLDFSVDHFLSNILNDNFQVRAKLFRRHFLKFFSLKSFVLLLVFTGMFLFSFKEAPNCIELIKAFKINWLATWIDPVVSNTSALSFLEAVSSERFFIRLFREFFFYLPMFVLILFIVDDLRRKAVVRVLIRLEGHLHFGNIYSSVVSKIIAKRVYQDTFSDSISIVAKKLALEKDKRLKVRMIYCSLICISIAISYSVYRNSLISFLDRHFY